MMNTQGETRFDWWVKVRKIWRCYTRETDESFPYIDNIWNRCCKIIGTNWWKVKSNVWLYIDSYVVWRTPPVLLRFELCIYNNVTLAPVMFDGLHVQTDRKCRGRNSELISLLRRFPPTAMPSQSKSKASRVNTGQFITYFVDALYIKAHLL